MGRLEAGSPSRRSSARRRRPRGQPYVIVVATVFAGERLIRRRPITTAPLYCLILPVIGHALLLRVLRGRVPGRAFDWSLLSFHRSTEVAARIAAVARHLASIELPAILLPLAALLLLLILTRPAFADPLLPALIGQELLYLAACVLSAFDPVWQVESALSRITIALFPTLLLAVSARAFRAAQGRVDLLPPSASPSPGPTA